MNIPESVLRSALVVGDKRISQSSDVGMLAYSVLADAYLSELDEMPITADELVKDGWEQCKSPSVFTRGCQILCSRKTGWRLYGPLDCLLQTMGELRTVLRLRWESA